MTYNQFSAIATILFALATYGYIKFTSRFRIMRRDYIDEIEYKAISSDAIIADLSAKLDRLLNEKVFTAETVAPGAVQMSFDLEARNSQKFRFPYTHCDPQTGELITETVTGRWTDWQAWQSGKVYVRRRSRYLWVKPNEVMENDLLPVFRPMKDKHNKKYEKQIWIYPDERKTGDRDTFPHELILEEA